MTLVEQGDFCREALNGKGGNSLRACNTKIYSSTDRRVKLLINRQYACKKCNRYSSSLRCHEHVMPAQKVQEDTSPTECGDSPCTVFKSDEHQYIDYTTLEKTTPSHVTHTIHKTKLYSELSDSSNEKSSIGHCEGHSNSDGIVDIPESAELTIPNIIINSSTSTTPSGESYTDQTCDIWPSIHSGDYECKIITSSGESIVYPKRTVQDEIELRRDLSRASSFGDYTALPTKILKAPISRRLVRRMRVRQVLEQQAKECRQRRINRVTKAAAIISPLLLILCFLLVLLI